MFRPWESKHNSLVDEGKLIPMADVDGDDECDGNGSDVQGEVSYQETGDTSINNNSPDKLPRTSTQRGCTLTRQAQQMLHSVYSFFLKEKEEGKPMKGFKAVLGRTALATGLCENTVRKHIKSGIVDTIRKKRVNRTNKKFGLVDDFTFSLLRRTVYDYYSKGIAPTAELLLKPMQRSTKGTEYEFPYKINTMREMLKHMGFQSKKVKTQTILMESPMIQHWRFRYLHHIEMYRREKRNIVFLGETWFNVGDKSCKAGSDGTQSSLVKCRSSGKGQRIMLLNAGNENGWIPGAQFILRAKTPGSCDYHEDMDSSKFEKWFAEQLLPGLPPGSVIVMDNATYHSRKTNKIPKHSWTKANIEEWLDAHRIPHLPKECTLKQTLLDIASASGIQESTAVDDLAKQHSCDVLRLPPYHCQFNPIELACSKVKQILRRHNTSMKPTESTIHLCTEAFNEVTAHDWRNYIAQVQKEEQLFQSGQMRYENEFQDCVIHLQVSESSDDSLDDD